MIHQFDHRAASVVVNPDNLHNTALSGNITPEQKADPAFISEPQYWVLENEVPVSRPWMVAFRDIARATDVRTMIAAAVPHVACGNKAPLLLVEDGTDSPCVHLLGNLNAIILDYVARSKAHSTSVNWYIVEQLPVVPPATYDTVKFGKKTAGEIVREIVLELTYTAHDMAPFARDMGYVDTAGKVKPPFVWDTMRRLHLRAKLDAIYFHLYGVTDRDDIRYIYSTFPIVARNEEKEHGRYLSCDLALAWLNAFTAGKPDATITV